MSLDPIDLHHQGAQRVIGSYLLETADGPALFDCGPSTCIDRLKDGLHQHGVELTDLRHLLLSHIHLDHAGAAGVLVREHPGLTVHVSEIGAPHLIDPTRLETSARRLYGDTFDALWGELAPIPKENVEIVGKHVLGLECFKTPRHASHHVSYVHGDGTLYAGDAAGVRLQPDRLVLPPTPPPEFDLEAWNRTLDQIERRSPARLALIHFGVADDIARHLAELRARLHSWVDGVGQGLNEDEFSRMVREELISEGVADVETYERTMPFWQSYAGLQRFWAKRRQSEG